jgi:predicted MFS family arabinose efflux permease
MTVSTIITRSNTRGVTVACARRRASARQHTLLLRARCRSTLANASPVRQLRIALAVSTPPAAEALRGLPRLRAVITVPGAIPLLLARSLGSLPIGMVPLGIILLLRAGGRSYALAGIADGAYALGVAAMQPMLGRLIDRVGMGRVLAPLAVVFPGMLVALALVGSSRAPAAATVGLALLSGATMPPLGACMRALWPTLIASPALRPTAYAIDATLQELAFVVGPPLLALLVAVADPEVALFGAAAAGGAGAVVFTSRAHARHEPTRRAAGALRSAGVRRILAMSAVLGGAFGATEVAMPAFCERHGARPAAGLLLAAVAIGSACGGAIFGGRASRMPAPRRLLVALGGYALLLTPLLVAPSIPVMAVFEFFGGMPIAPAFAGAYLLLDRFSVPGAVTETFAWNTTCLFTGASLGTALGGALVAWGTYRASIALAIGLGVACALLVAGFARGTQLDG